MKRTTIGVSIAALGAILWASTLLSCSNAQYVEANEFMELAQEIDQAGSVRNTEFIGVSNARAYLEHWELESSSGEKITVYWTRLTDLPENVASDLGAGKNPWIRVRGQDNQPLQTDAKSR